MIRSNEVREWEATQEHYAGIQEQRAGYGLLCKQMATEVCRQSYESGWQEYSYEFFKKSREVREIIAGNHIKPVFQPILSLTDGKVIGYEALSRIVGEYSVKSPDDLFEVASKSGVLWELEQVCRKKALQKTFSQQEGIYEKLLFLNVSPFVIHDSKFREGFTKEYLQRYHISPSQIVFELTERDSSKDLEGFLATMEHYRAQDYEIAIDDLGSCYSGLNLICDLNPHYIKLDMKLVRDIDSSNYQYSLVKSLVEFSNKSNVQIIAEGIESMEELETLIKIGVPYGQGYFLGKPQEELLEVDKTVKEAVRRMNFEGHDFHSRGVDNVYIKHICKKGMTVHANRKVEDILTCMNEQEDISGACVVSQGKVLGILTREKLQRLLSGRYGFSLNQKKEVIEIMQKEFLEIDWQTTISTVSAIAMERDEQNLYDFVVVTKDGEYYGVVTIKDLLLKSTEISISTARSSNPLSGLPGNLIINSELDRLMDQIEAFSVLYFDMDNFKAFNDVYGFEQGDEVIKITAQILRKNMDRNAFVGHIGGDDFLVILYNHNYQEIVKKVKQEFEEQTRKLYTREDLEKEFIVTKNRHGVLEKFPLLSMTVAVATNQDRTYASSQELSELLALRKKEAKCMQHGKVADNRVQIE